LRKGYDLTLSGISEKSLEIVMLNGAVIRCTLGPEKLVNEVNRI